MTSSGVSGAKEQASVRGASDFRGQLQDFRQRLSGQISSEAELAGLLSAPLVLIGVLHRDKTALGGENSASAAGQGSIARLGAPRRPGRDHLWLADLQGIILAQVFVDWSESIQEDDKLQGLAQAWFCPTSSPASAGCVYLASIASLTSHLIKLRAAAPAAAAPKQLEATSEALKHFLQGFSLPFVFAYIEKDVPTQQRALVWSTACRQLLSLPDRIANVFENNVPDELQLRCWQSRLLAEIEEAVWRQADAELVSSTLSRFLQARWLQEDKSTAGQSGPVSQLLRSCAQRIEAGGWSHAYRASWSAALRHLSQAEQDLLLETIISHCDRVVFREGNAAYLMTPEEARRPGAEGSYFMSARLLRQSSLAGALLGLFVVRGEADDEAGDSADDEIEADSLTRVVLPASSSSLRATWSPATARMLIHLLHRDAKSNVAAMQDLLTRAVTAWSRDVAKASDETQVYLTIVILLAMAALPDFGKNASDIALSGDFLQGVSAHLEHLSPLIRRLGMLVAEVVAQKSGRDLTFGRKLWDGRGEGKEEARVLRAAMLSFPSHTTDEELSTEALFEALHLHPEVKTEMRATTIDLAPRQRKKVPISRRLRERAAPRKSSVQAVEALEDSVVAPQDSGVGEARSLPSLFNVGSRPNLNPLVRGLASDSESASSSDSDSSDDEEAPPEPNAAEEGKAFGMGMPNAKKMARPPVYISELAPLLRSSERGAIRMGLRSAQALVERKAGWGGEVHDNAVNLSLALIALNNNFRIAKFEDRRTAALTALVVASPERVAPCLAEQYFVHQYSIAQRTSMLNALAFGARQLSTEAAMQTAQLTDTERGLEVLARDLAQLAIARARKDGEANVPELQREQSLLIDTLKTKAIDKQASRATGGSLKAPYLAVAQRCFIFPLVNRFWAYMQDTNVARKSRHLGSLGSSIIDMPFLLGAFFDTVAVLVYFAQHEAQFRKTVVPEVLELTLTISRPSLVSASADAKPDGQTETAGGSRSTVLGAAASLVLILLDASWQLDGGFTLCSHHADLFIEVQQWASAVFEAADGGSADRSSIGPNERAARSSAAILLRVHEMRERRRGG